MSPLLRALAPAKVNLWLHVAAPDLNGYHPLRSLVAFADMGDEVTFTPDPAQPISLHIEGPFARDLIRGADNLMLKAARAFEAQSRLKVGGLFTLRKNLPIASGLGGGSSDAGAALRLLREAFAPDMPDETLQAIAASLGADGAMCLWAKSCIAGGYGEKLTPVTMPSLPAVLINPGVECPTGEVYRAYDDVAQKRDLQEVGSPGSNISSMIDYVAANRNDLETAAIRLKPEIGETLSLLRHQPEVRLARMSGSGATCFALCHSDEEAQQLCDRLNRQLAGVWVVACRLG